MSFKIIGIGEVLWDLLPSGPQLGGAPANFACHARQLGAEAQVITRVGKDAYGWQILQRFQEMRLPGDAVQLDEHLPTGTATVALDSSGLPQFTIHAPVAWDGLSVTQHALETLQHAHAVCFGTLAQRCETAAAAIQQLVAATPVASLRVLDINLRQRFYTRDVVQQSLALANVVKLNDHELTVLSPMLALTGSVKQRMEQLVRQFDLQVVALTRAQHGSLLYQTGDWSDSPGSPVAVVDTVGAGDAFTAALVLGLLNRWSLGDIHRLAESLAGYVCSRPGATPVLPDELRAAFASICTRV